MRKTMQRKRMAVICVCVCCLAAALIIQACVSKVRAEERAPYDRQTVLAYLDEEKIVYGEFVLLLPRYRAIVVSEMNQRYSLTETEGFWDTELPDGRTPSVIVKEMVMEQLGKMKAEQILYREYGILEQIDYENFHSAWIAENERRDRAADSGQVIYGPRQYEEGFYYSYVLDQCCNELERRMGDEKANSLLEEKKKKAVLTVDERAVKNIVIN